MTDYVLFKYRKIDKNLLKSLVHSEIFFAGPDRLNDPFDCKVEILKALENAIARAPGQSRTKLEKLRGISGFFEKVQADFSKVGVCSFTLDLKSSLMWSHYADDHRGICLTYSFPESFFHDNSGQILGTDKVDYGTNPLSNWFVEVAPSLNSFEEFGISLIKKILVVKAQPWDYEKEVRIVRKTEGVHVIDKLYLKQVCFGLRTSQSDMALVQALLDDCGYDVVLCRMIRTAGSDFEVDAVAI
jgi:hypothetical protein